MEWLSNNFPTVLIVIGLGLLAIEVGLLGFSVFILFFIGLACIATGLLIMAGLFAPTLSTAFGGVAILSIAFAVLLWKPLQRLQENGSKETVKGDFVGHSFVLSGAVAPNEYSIHRYSGIDWKVRSETPIAAGQEVEVVKAEVGMLTVALKA